MKIEELPQVGNAKRELITLDDGETTDAAGTTKYRWRGPGAFRRQIWPDGSREDFHAMDRQAAMLVGAEDDASYHVGHHRVTETDERKENNG